MCRGPSTGSCRSLGFRFAGVVKDSYFTLVRFRSETPRHVTEAEIAKNRIGGGTATRTDVLFDDAKP